MSGVTSLNGLTGVLSCQSTNTGALSISGAGQNVVFQPLSGGVTEITADGQVTTGPVKFIDGTGITITNDGFGGLTFNGGAGGGNWSYKGVFNGTTGTAYALNDVAFDTVNTSQTYVCISAYTVPGVAVPPSNDATHWLLFATNTSSSSGGVTGLLAGVGGTPSTGAVPIVAGTGISVTGAGGANASLTIANTATPTSVVVGSGSPASGALTFAGSVTQSGSTFTFTGGSAGGGNWSYKGVFLATAGTAYIVNDVVFDTVNTTQTYVCILGYTTGASASAPSANPTNWLLFATNATPTVPTALVNAPNSFSLGGGSSGATLSTSGAGLLMVNNTQTQQPPTIVLQRVDPTYGGITTQMGQFYNPDATNPSLCLLQTMADATQSSTYSTDNNPIATYGGVWASGTLNPGQNNTYTAGTVVKSPANNLYYVCILATAYSSTDPSSDPTHWGLLGDTGNWSYKSVFVPTIGVRYALNDVVFDTVNTAETYICILAYTVGATPVAPSSDATHWKLFATNSDTTVANPMTNPNAGSNQNSWVSGSPYAVGSVVFSAIAPYNWCLCYVAVPPGNTTDPQTDINSGSFGQGTYWQLLATEGFTTTSGTTPGTFYGALTLSGSAITSTNLTTGEVVINLPAVPTSISQAGGTISVGTSGEASVVTATGQNFTVASPQTTGTSSSCIVGSAGASLISGSTTLTTAQASIGASIGGDVSISTGLDRLATITSPYGLGGTKSATVSLNQNVTVSSTDALINITTDTHTLKLQGSGGAGAYASLSTTDATPTNTISLVNPTSSITLGQPTTTPPSTGLYVDSGRLLFNGSAVAGGNWSYKSVFVATAGTVYALNDVAFDTVNTGQTYVCILGYTTGAGASAPSADATHWSLFATNSATANASAISQAGGSVAVDTAGKITVNPSATADISVYTGAVAPPAPTGAGNIFIETGTPFPSGGATLNNSIFISADYPATNNGIVSLGGGQCGLQGYDVKVYAQQGVGALGGETVKIHTNNGNISMWNGATEPSIPANSTNNILIQTQAGPPSFTTPPTISIVNGGAGVQLFQDSVLLTSTASPPATIPSVGLFITATALYFNGVQITVP